MTPYGLKTLDHGRRGGGGARGDPGVVDEAIRWLADIRAGYLQLDADGWVLAAFGPRPMGARGSTFDAFVVVKWAPP